MEDSSFERRRVPVRRKGEMRVWRLRNWGLRVRLYRTSRREGLLSCSPLRENDFEDGHNQFYRFLEHDPAISKCFNFRGATNDNEPKSTAVVGERLTKLMTAILEAYSSDDRFYLDYSQICFLLKSYLDLKEFRS